MTDHTDWTLAQVIAELRRRERRGTSAAPPEGSGTRSLTSRSPDIGEVATSDLAQIAKDGQRGIYGVDDRRDLFQVTNAKIRRAADAVVALVAAKDLKAAGDGGWTLKTTSYQETFDLCTNEPFSSQPLGCDCSGFLVRPDVVATAGHCITKPADLARTRFVFGFRMLNLNAAKTRFGADDVYEGVEILGREFTPDKTDWAIVRLDRPVRGRKPVAFRTSGKVASNQKLFVIGHPCGLPQKYAGGATVRDNAPKAFFVANLDTYGGNSGSPVFNAATHSVEGILVRGENDFVKSGACFVSLVCPTTGCRGEDVTRASEWATTVPPAAKARKPKKAGTTRRSSSPKSARRR